MCALNPFNFDRLCVCVFSFYESMRSVQPVQHLRTYNIRIHHCVSPYLLRCSAYWILENQRFYRNASEQIEYSEFPILPAGKRAECDGCTIHCIPLWLWVCSSRYELRSAMHCAFYAGIFIFHSISHFIGAWQQQENGIEISMHNSNFRSYFVFWMNT